MVGAVWLAFNTASRQPRYVRAIEHYATNSYNSQNTPLRQYEIPAIGYE